MMKLSTFQITLLAIFGSVGVAGILIFALLAASGNVSSTGAVVIWGTFEEPQIRTILREAADSDNRFSEVSYVKKDPALYDAELRDALANGRGPDVFIMRQDYAVRDSGYTVRIPYNNFSEAQFKATFLDAAEPFLASDGVVAFPFAVDPLVLFWNKDALASAGISSPPQYWDQLPAMVQLLVKKSDSGTVTKGGIALGNYDNIRSAKDILATMILQAGGAITGRDAQGVIRPLLATQGGTTKSTVALNFYTEFADPAQPHYSWSKAFLDAQKAFAAADVAMYIGHASEFNAINDLNPNLNFAIAPLPQIRSAQYALNTSHVYGFSVSRASKNVGGAVTIAAALAGPDIGGKITKAVGMVSALRRVLNPETPQQPSNAAIQAQQDAFAALSGPTPKTTDQLLALQSNISKPWLDPDPDKTNEIFRDMIENTVNGARRATEAVQRADKQIAELLNL